MHLETTLPVVLVVDDEEDFRASLGHALGREGYRVLTAVDGPSAVLVARKEQPDLILLDLMLPGMPGLEVCRSIREWRDRLQPGIIMVTAKSTDIDAVTGLESGADDYVSKPFNLGLLLARMRALLRRLKRQRSTSTGAASHDQTVQLGDLAMDLQAYEVFCHGKPIDLSPRLFSMLAYLAKNAGRVVTRDELLNQVWGYEYIGQTRTVDVHVHWLREQLDRAGCGDYIHTIRGVGYKMTAPEV